MSGREAIITRVMEAGGRLTVRSALNPILWLCGIITVPSLVVVGLKTDPPSWLLVLAFAPEVAAILGFGFLLLFDRDKLQSEEYQIRKMQLEMIEEKGKPPLDPSIVEALPPVPEDERLFLSDETGK
jgi:hypothetical protein